MKAEFRVGMIMIGLLSVWMTLSASRNETPDENRTVKQSPVTVSTPIAVSTPIVDDYSASLRTGEVSEYRIELTGVEGARFDGTYYFKSSNPDRGDINQSREISGLLPQNIIVRGDRNAKVGANITVHADEGSTRIKIFKDGIECKPLADEDRSNGNTCFSNPNPIP